jgi:hypothetical protein
VTARKKEREKERKKRKKGMNEKMKEREKKRRKKKRRRILRTTERKNENRGVTDRGRGGNVGAPKQETSSGIECEESLWWWWRRWLVWWAHDAEVRAAVVVPVSFESTAYTYDPSACC